MKEKIAKTLWGVASFSDLSFGSELRDVTDKASFQLRDRAGEL